MAQATKSTVMKALKTKLKGAWKSARTVEPKARGGGGLPANLKNAVALCKTYKMDLTQKGDPYFMLGVVMKEPDDLEGKQAAIMWFINENDYATVEENAQAFANDLKLMLPDQEIPEDEGELLDCLKDLCERGVHILLNTGRERSKGRSPNIFIQGLAEGWEDDPDPEAGEAPSREEREASRKRGPKSEANGAPDDEPQDEVVEEVEEVVEEVEGDTEEVYIPKVKDVYLFKAPKAKEAEEYIVTAVDEGKEQVSLKQKSVKRGAKALQFAKVPFAKLGSA